MGTVEVVEKSCSGLRVQEWRTALSSACAPLWSSIRSPITETQPCSLPFLPDSFKPPQRSIDKPFRLCVSDVFKGECCSAWCACLLRVLLSGTVMLGHWTVECLPQCKDGQQDGQQDRQQALGHHRARPRLLNTLQFTTTSHLSYLSGAESPKLHLSDLRQIG